MRKGFFNKMQGSCGEDAAADYLIKNNYKIIKRNYRNKTGEIDIIAKMGDELIFVEVKTRSNSLFGTPAQAVTYYKKQRMVNAARLYIAENPTDCNIRFDVIEVFGVYTGDIFELENINHIQQAFLEV